MSSSSNAWSEASSAYSFSLGVPRPAAGSSSGPDCTPANEGYLDCKFQAVRASCGHQLLAYRAVTSFCDSHQRSIPFSQLMGWAKSRELQGIFHSYRLQEILAQAGPCLGGARLMLPVEVNLFYGSQWSWVELAERAEQVGVLSGQLIWEVLESECHADGRAALRFMNEGREFFSRYAITIGATRSPDWDLIKLLKPDFLQLPEQLVNGCTSGTYRREWVAGTIRQAKDLGVKVLACGVHAKADWEWLREQDIAGGTGSWLGNPAALPVKREPLV